MTLSFSAGQPCSAGQRLGRAASAAVLGAAVLLLAGCASVEKGGTNLVLGTLERNVVPPVLKTPDLNMGCNYAVANVPLVNSFRSFHGDTQGLESILQSSAAICADLDAGSEELRALRAQRDHRPDEAIDARINQKRLLERTARRQLAAYELMKERLQAKYRFVYGQGCPRFKTDFDEMIYLLGTINSLQAMVNDIAAQHPLNVSTDIPPKAEFAMTCLDNAKWWGTPAAVRATVWSVVPGGSAGHDIAGTFDLSMAIGEREGVRISHVLAAIAAASTDDQPRIRAIIRRASRPPQYRNSEDYRYIDEIGLAILQQMSDRDWTLGTGSRTPMAALGTFWDEKPATKDDVDASQFLN